jgi:6-phosphogluconolactonase (cycloisomerase 2 family)
MTDLFVGIGPRLLHARLDNRSLAISEGSSVTLPANIQYAWPGRQKQILYVASSDAAGRDGPRGGCHHLSAWAFDAENGVLMPHGDAVPLPSRPIHLTLDDSAQHILLAFCDPSAIRVYRVDENGRLGAEVRQAGTADVGIYPHQIRLTLDGWHAIAVALGRSPHAGKPEQPGRLTLFDYQDGMLSHPRVTAPNGGLDFGPRHLDFHPNGRWVYVSLERQNRLVMFELDGDILSATPRFSSNLLSRPKVDGIKQIAGAVHVHPSGRFVYVVNRASDSMEVDGTRVLAGGENTLVVFAIDPATGDPKPIQHVDTGGIHCRTFQIDPTGQTLVAAHIMGLGILDDGRIRWSPPCLSTFRVADDGHLQFDYAHPVKTNGMSMFWMGMMPTATPSHV